MHDLARVSVLGALALAGLLGAVACWQVAPDSANDVFLESGTDSLGDEPNYYDGPTGDGGPQGDGGPVGDSPVDGEGQAPLVILPTASPALATGVGFGCSIDVSGAVWCWGDNTYGQAGSTPGSGVAPPQVVPGVVGAATGLALGDHHACAVTASHAVYCWGLNGSYQLGHAAASAGDLICPGAVAGQTVPCAPTPAVVAGLPPAVAIAAAGAWTCIVASDGSVQCWGGMQTPSTTDAGVPCGEGTQPTGGTCYHAPTTIPGVAGATLLAVGYDHACAVVAAGSITDAGNALACWGRNNEAQVAPSACPQSICTAPVARGDLPTTTSLVAGNAFTCALAADGSVRCFGDNTYGELGHTSGQSGDLGTPNPEGGLGVFNPTPTMASATTVASLVGGGNQATCALLGTGTAECWGGTTGTASVPVAVTGLPLLNALGTYDGAYVCGVSATDGSIWCWTMGGAAPAQVEPVDAGPADAGEAG